MHNINNETTQTHELNINEKEDIENNKENTGVEKSTKSTVEDNNITIQYIIFIYNVYTYLIYV